MDLCEKCGVNLAITGKSHNCRPRPLPMSVAEIDKKFVGETVTVLPAAAKVVVGTVSPPVPTASLVPGQPCPTCGKKVGLSAVERKRKQRGR